ncbi:Formin-like protein 8, partial [Frankliniella fusca]
ATDWPGRVRGENPPGPQRKRYLFGPLGSPKGPQGALRTPLCPTRENKVRNGQKKIREQIRRRKGGSGSALTRPKLRDVHSRLTAPTLVEWAAVRKPDCWLDRDS